MHHLLRTQVEELVQLGVTDTPHFDCDDTVKNIMYLNNCNIIHKLLCHYILHLTQFE